MRCGAGARLLNMMDSELTRSRQPLQAAELRALSPQWSQVDVVESTGSTNMDVKKLAAAGAPHRSAVVASSQSAGRGRLGRRWESPPGAAIALSALFRPRNLDLSQLGVLPLVCGVAVVDMLTNTAGLSRAQVSLKWPNDVLVEGRKIAGILVEAASLSPVALIPGIGLNVSLRESELPVAHATSLLLAGATNLDRTELAAALLRALATREQQWEEHDRQLMADYRALCDTLGREVKVELPGSQELRGRAVEVLSTGELVVDVAGQRHVVAAGDVFHLRSAEGEYASQSEDKEGGSGLSPR